MYIPASFREDDPHQLHALMRAHPLGLLVSHGERGLEVSSIPFEFDPEGGARGVLRAHMARANPHWKSLSAQAECLVVFQGPQGYVTPSWYASKAETHRVVPTWNYAMVEVRGHPTVIDDAGWLRRQLEELTNRHEYGRSPPWSVDDAPADYLASQMKAIIGLEIAVSRLEGKWKMSQNREDADRQGVVAGMRSDADPHRNLPVAELVDRR